MRVVIDHGKKTLVAAAPVTNPAMTCSDMFSWKLFADAIGDDFLQRWASDSDTFPGDGKNVFPWPLCTGAESANCCRPGAQTDRMHCPYFPGAGTNTLGARKKAAPVRQLKRPGLQRFLLQHPGDTGLLEAARGTSPSLSPDDPTRKLRQENNELVFRNESMVRYIFDNGIYYAEGLGRVFTHATTDVAENAPYHRPNAPRDLTTIEFPADAVMIKANFVTPVQAQTVGLKNNPDHPIIRMRLVPPEGGDAQEYWLLGFHISSKDTPQWVWTTFEYVGNIGRCDFIGCNDSFGFTAPTPAHAQSAGNFHEPHTTSDGFANPGTIYALNGTYRAETIRPRLAALFEQLGIGTAPNEQPPADLTGTQNWFPNMKDKAWRSYRLKGSQVNFVDATGHSMLLGNSVTEAGFVTSSSCITCHSRANTNRCGKPAIGVFEPSVQFQGYPTSSNGTPNAAWYNANSTTPAPLAIQTDFLWGFLNVQATTKDYACTP